MPLIGRNNVSNAIDDLYVAQNNKLRKVFFSGVREIIKGTPVDTGRARNNWQGTAKRLPKKVLNKKFILFNNLPYIHTLEYGGYSQPGTTKTIGGFSKQAPKGWVRAAVIIMQNKIRDL